MTVRAIDMITLLPRTGEAGRAHQQAQQQPHVLQHAQTAQQQAKAQRAQEQVVEKSFAEQVNVRKDGRGRQGAPGEQRDGRGRPPDEQKHDAPAPPGIGQRLDIKI